MKKLWSLFQENAAVAVSGAAALAIAGLTMSGSLAWADARYVLQTAYTSDQMAQGLVVVEMQVKQADYRIRDAQMAETAAQVKGETVEAAQARANEAYFKAEREELLRKRDYILRQ